MSMRLPRPLLLMALALAQLALVGCGVGESQFADLRVYMDEVYGRRAPAVPPLPEFKPYQAFSYRAATLRPPFTPPEPPPPPTPPGQEDIEPDPTRVKQFLEGFDVASLAMVGTLERDQEIYALIRDAEGRLFRKLDVSPKPISPTPGSYSKRSSPTVPEAGSSATAQSTWWVCSEHTLFRGPSHGSK